MPARSAPSLRRPLARAAVALLAGAAVNVAVAWTFAATRYPLKPRQSPAPGWHCRMAGRATGSLYTGASPGIVYIKEIYLHTEGAPKTAHSVASGWPALALATTWLTDDRGRLVPSSLWRQGVRLPRTLEQEVGLFNATDSHVPIRPVLRGFLLNTLLYAAPLLLPLGCIELRRWRRDRRGGCARCGYDLTGLAPGCPCPECGSPRSIDAL